MKPPTALALAVERALRRRAERQQHEADQQRYREEDPRLGVFTGQVLAVRYDEKGEPTYE